MEKAGQLHLLGAETVDGLGRDVVMVNQKGAQKRISRESSTPLRLSMTHGESMWERKTPRPQGRGSFTLAKTWRCLKKSLCDT